MNEECSSVIHKYSLLILLRLSDFVKCRRNINFCSMSSIYIILERCYEVESEQLFSSSIHKYNISSLLHLSDFCTNFHSVVSSLLHANATFFSSQTIYSISIMFGENIFLVLY